MTRNKPYVLDFGKMGSEETGFLSVGEYASSLPFEMKRIYWVYDTAEDLSRGNAANIHCQNILVVMHGSAEVYVEDQKNNSYQFTLSTKSEGLLIPAMHWRRIRLDKNAVLLCIASEKYEESDYIRDFKAFRKVKIPK